MQKRLIISLLNRRTGLLLVTILFVFSQLTLLAIALPNTVSAAPIFNEFNVGLKQYDVNLDSNLVYVSNNGLLFATTGRFTDGGGVTKQAPFVVNRQSGEFDQVDYDNLGGYLSNRDGDTNIQVKDMSLDGRFVLFNSMDGVYVADTLEQSTTRISSMGNGYASELSMSADGRFVAFQSFLGSGQSTIHLWDGLNNSSITIGTDAVAGSPTPIVSASGRFIVYSDNGAIYRYDVWSSQKLRISEPEESVAMFSISDDARYVAYRSDTEDRVKIRDALTSQVIRKSIGSTVPILSGDGSTLIIGTQYNAEYPQSRGTFYSSPIAGPELHMSGGSPAVSISNDGDAIGVDGGDWNLDRIVTVARGVADSMPPTFATPGWTFNPKALGQSATLTVPATDDASEITQAEYFIGDTDPGQGNGATMTLANVQDGGLSADLTTTFGTDFPTGVYKISVRAQDAAGNWSDPISDYLVVYDPAGPKMTGKRTIIPSLANGDVIPGLIAGDQTDKAKFAFSVKYNNQGQINANSDLQFSYSTGTRCNNPNNAQNCHTLTLNATSIAWLTTQGDNNSTGVFQGVATMVVDGQTSTVLFRVTGVDGERLSPTATDRFQIQVFNQGDNPNTATPLYVVNSANIARGNIKIQ